MAKAPQEKPVKRKARVTLLRALREHGLTKEEADMCARVDRVAAAAVKAIKQEVRAINREVDRDMRNATRKMREEFLAIAIAKKK